MNNFIEAAWKEYRDAVVHPESPPEHIRDLRMSFFGGMQLVIHEFAKAAGDKRLQRMAQIQDELSKWFKEFKKDTLQHDPFSDN